LFLKGARAEKQKRKIEREREREKRKKKIDFPHCYLMSVVEFLHY
jgi:hypothetical protein